MKFLLSICFILASLSLFAQKDYATDRSVSKKIINTYDEAFRNAANNQFSKAEQNLDWIIEKEPTFLDARILRANVYYELEKYAAAEKEFEYILSIDPAFNYRIYYNLALTENKLEKYAEAAVHFRDFLNTDPDARMQAKAKKHLENSEFLAYAHANPVPFQPENLGPVINSDAQEYLPSFTADGQSLIFTRRLRKMGSEDFFISKKDENGEWLSPQPITDINTPDNEGAQTVTADGRLLIFTGCNRAKNIGGCDLYFSEFRNGAYTKPQLMPEPINTRYWESQPSLTPNGDALYFASTRPGGLGKSDLFVSYRINGQWTTPRNLGKSVNTPEDDVTPFIHADGQTLYFASEGHPGVGGRDLYYARWNPAARDWDKPTNMGLPINTKQEEGALTVSLDGKTAYFATDRKDLDNAQGAIDLYKFDLHEAAQPQQVTYVKASVVDALTGQPLLVKAEITDLTKNTPYTSAQTDVDGTFLIVMGLGKNYGLSVNKEGYLFHSENFALHKKQQNEPFLLQIKLQAISEQDNSTSEPISAEPVVLKNIFFETGSAELLPASTNELSRLKKLLDDTPSLKIRIDGHTDNVGSESDNLSLSEARAKSVYDWLIDNGIEASRLKYKGLGEQVPLASNETEIGRRTNRRTEFVMW